MACCGQKRSQAQIASPSALHTAGPAPTGYGTVGHVFARGDAPVRGVQAPAVNARSVVLRYHERVRMVVRGPVTGHHYAFSAEQPAQAVDARDAEALLRTRRFVRG